MKMQMDKETKLYFEDSEEDIQKYKECGLLEMIPTEDHGRFSRLLGNQHCYIGQVWSLQNGVDPYSYPTAKEMEYIKTDLYKYNFSLLQKQVKDCNIEQFTEFVFPAIISIFKNLKFTWDVARFPAFLYNGKVYNTSAQTFITHYDPSGVCAANDIYENITKELNKKFHNKHVVFYTPFGFVNFVNGLISLYTKCVVVDK